MCRLKSDEELELFPVVAKRTLNGWSLELHAWVYEPEIDSIRRSLAISVLAESLGLSNDDTGSDVFAKRARVFLVDNERKKEISVALCGRRFDLAPTGPDGHSRTILQLPAEALTGEPEPVTAILDEGDTREFVGCVYPLLPEGVSVISDIDDTIKISNVRDKKALLSNTFLKEFVAVPGLAQAYKRWEGLGASFHYVSASPWQLYSSLADFFKTATFPLGSVHLKQFRLKDASFLSLFQDPIEYKTAIIQELLSSAPGRRFVLVGDSGEKDPEVYAKTIGNWPSQISHIYIRDVTGEERESVRYQKTCKDVPADRWSLFTDPTMLPESL